MNFEKEYKKLKEEMSELEKSFDDPKITSDHKKMKDRSRRYGEVKDLVQKIEEWKKLSESIKENEKIDDEELKKLADEENKESKEKMKEIEGDIKNLTAPEDPNDKRNVVLEIRAGAGGDEASLFSGDLFRMYTKYCEEQGWAIETLNRSRNEIGGFKEIIASITGKNVYKHLKHESGVHRVQRIPATEKSGRIHTSTVTTAILPEAEDVEISIDAKDLKIEVFRSSGPGGQSVNTTDSAVRITHLPTNIVVSCQDQKSQHKNREKAMKILKARLLAAEKEKKDKEEESIRTSQVGTGDRSEKIRTYNFPQNRVTDHRIPKTWHSLDKIMEGEIDDIIKSLNEYQQKVASQE